MAQNNFNGSPVWLWIVAILLAAIDAFVIFWTPGPGDYKSPLAAAVVSFFLVLIIVAIVSGRAGTPPGAGNTRASGRRRTGA